MGDATVRMVNSNISNASWLNGINPSDNAQLPIVQ
jgi:hypothetical protein